MTVFDQNEISTNDFAEYIKKLKKESEAEYSAYLEEIKKVNKKWDNIAIECKQCGIKMGLYPVNTVPSNQTGDDSKSMWFCRKCWNDEYSTKSVREWIESTNKER